jgi:drug/metabolite transporter (DMT)-like permease
MSKNETFIFASGAFWIALYFLANLVLTIHNKWVLSKLHFDFPWLLSAIHIGVSGLGSYLCVRFSPFSSFNSSSGTGSPPLGTLHPDSCPPLSHQDYIKLFLFSLLYTINISMSNVSLNYVSLSFHQIVRSTNPIFTILLEYLIFGKRETPWIYVSLVPVVIGVCLATLGEYEHALAFDALGLSLTLFGVLLSALKGIATNWLMVGSLKLPPLVLIAKIAPMCLLQCFLYALLFGEVRGFLAMSSDLYAISSTYSTSFFDSELLLLYLKLAMNGFFAFFLNYVSFTANKLTSALSMTVAGNVKQAVSILLAVYIFMTPISWNNAMGILITLAGGAWYR